MAPRKRTRTRRVTPENIDAVVALLTERGAPMTIHDVGAALDRSWSWANQAVIVAVRERRLHRSKNRAAAIGVPFPAEGSTPDLSDRPPIERYLARSPRTAFDVAARFNLPSEAHGRAMCVRLVAEGVATHDPELDAYVIVERLDPRDPRTSGV